MQATVHTFDADRGSGSVLLDDGCTVPFSAEVFWASGLRLLRPGQRLTVELDPTTTAARLARLGIHGILG